MSWFQSHSPARSEDPAGQCLEAGKDGTFPTLKRSSCDSQKPKQLISPMAIPSLLWSLLAALQGSPRGVSVVLQEPLLNLTLLIFTASRSIGIDAKFYAWPTPYTLRHASGCGPKCSTRPSLVVLLVLWKLGLESHVEPDHTLCSKDLSREPDQCVHAFGGTAR